MKFTIYQGSRQGSRLYNQDRLAYSYSKEALLMVIADGMGGHRNGEVAAQLAVQMLTEAFQRHALPLLQSPGTFLNQTILEIHEAIDDIRKHNNLVEAPRTTIAAAVVQKNRAYLAHVGDSRIYHFRDSTQLFKTEDHSVVQMLFRKGQITLEQMAVHPERHKIFNCLGSKATPQVSISKREVLEGDVLFLCTDGLWSVMSEAEIADSLFLGPVNVTGARILETAESEHKENSDNLSLICMQWGDRASSDHAVSTGTMPLGETTTILNPPTQQPTLRFDGEDGAPPDLTDAEIERAIASIQAAIQKSKHK